MLVQFHIDQEEETSRTPGPVKLLLPGLSNLEKQLQSLQPRFVETHFAFDFSSSSRQANVTDPWGQQFSISECSGSSVAGHKQAGSFEGLTLPCHVGTASAIAEFYRRIVGVSHLAYQISSKLTSTSSASIHQGLLKHSLRS